MIGVWESSSPPQGFNFRGAFRSDDPNGLLMNAAEDSYNKNCSFLVKIVKHLLPLLLLILPEDDLREWAEFAMGLILSRCIAPVLIVPSS